MKEASLDLIESEQKQQQDHVKNGRPQSLEAAAATASAGADSKVTSFLRAARSGDLRKIVDLIELDIVDINASNANGLNALHLATKENHKEVCLELIKRGIDINSATKKGNTAVHIAALSGNLDILKILLANGGDQDMKTQSGFTALYMAAQENHYECVKYLIENGCNTQLTTNDGFTPLDVAIQQGHKKISTYLLKALTRGPSVDRDATINSRGSYNNESSMDYTDSGGVQKVQDDDKKYKLHALHLAAKKNDVKNGEFLLKKMKISPNITSKSGFTPMHIAAHYDNVDFGRLLLDEPSCQVNFRAKHQITPIHVASKWGKINFLKFLLENGGDIYAKTKDQLTPLHCAARSGHLDALQLLLEENFNLIESKTKNGLTPLHMTVQGNHLEATKYLIRVNKNGVHSLTNDSLTPLHIAVHYNFYEQCEVLLENGANCYVKAMNGFTPVHIACKKKFYKILILLMKYMNRRVPDQNGYSDQDQQQQRRITDGNAMQVAVEMGSIEVVKFLLENERSIKREIEGDDNAESETDNATSNGSVSESTFLESTNERGETPLHAGVMTCNLEIIRVLLEKMPNKTEALNQGTVGDNQNPLFYAIREMKRSENPDKLANSEEELSPAELKKLQVIKYLMENGANLEQQTLRNHWTPFMYAVKLRQHLIVQYFIDSIRANNPPEQANEILYNLINKCKLKKNRFNSVHLAVKQNDLKMLKILLRNGGNLNEKTISGYTPFILACHYGHADIIQFLLNLYEQFESKKNHIFSVYYAKGQSEDVPAENLEEETINFLYNDPNLMKKLYCDGDRPEGLDPENDDLQIVENKYLFNINQKTDSGNTALHQAVQQQHFMVIRLLLSNKKVNVNEPNNMNITPFGLAKQFHLIEIVKEFQFVHEEKIVENTTKRVSDDDLDANHKPANDDALDRLKQMPEDENSDDDIENEKIVREFVVVQTKSSHEPNDEINYGKRPTENGQEIITVERSDINNINNGNSNEGDLTINGDGFLMDYSSNNTKNLSIMDHLTDNGDQAELADEDFEEPMQPQLPPVQAGFLVSFLVDARGGEMQGCRQSGIRVIVPPKTCQQPTRITCRYLRNNAVAGHGPATNTQQITAPPLMEGESLVSQILELGPPGAKFLGPVTLEIPHFASLRTNERELIVLRSENGEIWREHTNTIPTDSEGTPLPAIKTDSQKITLYCETFPNYFAIISRIRQEIFIIGTHGGRIVNDNLVKRKRVASSDLEPEELDEEARKSVGDEGGEDMTVEAHFPENALTKNIRVGLQVLDTKMQTNTESGNLFQFHTSPVVTIEPRRRKFHKAITLVIPIAIPSEELKNFSLKNLHLFCSITGGQHSSQWEDVTGSTPLQLFNVKGGEGQKNKNLKYISFTTTVSARFWLVYFNISPSLLALNYKFYFDEEKNKYLFSVKPGTPSDKGNESMANLNLFHYFINELSFLTKFYNYLTKIPIYCKIKMYLIKNFDENVEPQSSEVKMKFLLLISNCVGGDVHFGQKLNQSISQGTRSNSASCGDISASGAGEFIQLFETKKIEFIKDFEVKMKISQHTSNEGAWDYVLNKKNDHFYNDNELRFTLNEVFFMNKKVFFEINFKDAVTIDKQLAEDEAMRFSLTATVPSVYHSNPNGKTVQNAEIEFEKERRICSLNFSLQKYKQIFLNELVQQQNHVPPKISLKDQEYKFQAGSASGDFLYKEIKINLNDLVEMLNDDDWHRLGTLLNINKVDLNLIKEEFPDDSKKCGMVMMKLFLKQQEQNYAEQSGNQKENFYFKIGKKLEVALIELNRFDIVERLFRFDNQNDKQKVQQRIKSDEAINGQTKSQEGLNEEEVMNEVERHEYSDDGGLNDDHPVQSTVIENPMVQTSSKVITERATTDDYSDDNLDRDTKHEELLADEEVVEEEFSISSNLKSDSVSENAVYESNWAQSPASPTSTSSAASLNQQQPNQSPSANPKVASSPSGIPTLIKSNNNNNNNNSNNTNSSSGKNKKLKKKNKKNKSKTNDEDDDEDQNTGN